MDNDKITENTVASEPAVSARRKTAEKSRNSYNPRHVLVPEVHLLSDDDAKKVLDKLGVEKDKLPKIKMDDPAIQYLSSIHGSVAEGSIIEVIRKSETAGEFSAYRLVIRG